MSSKVVSLTIPEDLVSGLDVIASHLSVSRSAVVSALLVERVPMYSSMCADSPPLDHDTSRRFVGSSQGAIVDMLGQLSVGRGVTQRDLFEK